jgi:hypothetical protein
MSVYRKNIGGFGGCFTAFVYKNGMFVKIFLSGGTIMKNITCIYRTGKTGSGK